MAAWAANQSTNLGLVLAAPDEGDSFAWKKFSSFETGAPPALHVVWSEPPGATIPGPPRARLPTPPASRHSSPGQAPASNGGAAINGYGVWAWTYPGFVAVSFTEACATCTYVGIGGLTNGQQYYFGVYARNAVGWGTGAGTNVITPAPVAPSAPPSASAVKGNQSATVSWAPSTNNGGAAIDAYGVFAYNYPSYTYANNYTQACGSCTTATVTGLTNGQQYAFVVYTHSAAPLWSSSGTLTNPVTPSLPTTTTTSSTSTTTTSTSTTTTTSTTVPPTPPPSQIQNVTASANSSQSIHVSWGPSPSTEVVTRYSLLLEPECDSCDGLVVNDGGTNFSSITGLSPATEYVIRVVAHNTGGAGPLSAVTDDSRATTFATSPDAPSNVTATAGDTKATVTWTPPAGEALHGSTLTGFGVKVTPECVCTGLNVIDIEATSSVVTGLENGQSYTFQVQARSSAGPSAYVPEPGVTITPIPAVKVMSWNVRRGLSQDNIDAFAEEVNNSGAEIVGFQEITEDIATGIADSLQWPAPYYVETDKPCIIPDPLFPTIQTCQSYGNAIISKFPLGNNMSWTLSPPEEESSIGRKLLRATVTIGPRQVFFYTTHFSTASGATLEERRLQAVQVRQQVQADTNGGSSTVTGIVTGDFNARPDNPLVTEDMGSLFDDAWIAGEYPPGGGLTGCYDGASEPTCRIDYIFFTRSSGFSPLRVVVGVDSSLSDHRPVSADLQ